MKIQDGTGYGYAAKISNLNKLETEALQIPRMYFESGVNASAYVLASGHQPITTTASYTGFFYVKYTGEKNLHIFSIRTCGDQAAKYRLIKNPTTGTLISAGNTAPKENMNFNSSLVLDSVVNYGTDAQTITDGSLFGTWQDDSGYSVGEFDGAVILGKGDSIGLEVKPDLAADICTTWIVWEGFDD